jgi:hypothetical protein
MEMEQATEQIPIIKKRKNYYPTNPEKFKRMSKRHYDERGGKQLKQLYYEENRARMINQASERYYANREKILEARKLKLIETKLSKLNIDNGNTTANDAIPTTETTKSET